MGGPWNDPREEDGGGDKTVHGMHYETSVEAATLFAHATRVNGDGATRVNDDGDESEGDASDESEGGAAGGAGDAGKQR